MNWIKANTFLSAFFAVMLLGVAVLGYLLLSAQGRHAEIATQYEEQAAKLSRLEGLVPYPAEENLKKLEEQKKEHQAAVTALQAELAKNELALEPLTDVQFQDKLKESVARVRAKAAERGMAVPADFFMGYKRYEAQPPPAVAASALGRHLKAVEFIVMQLIETGAVSLESLEPQPLPEEGIAKKGGDKPDANAETKGGEKSGRNDNENALVSRHPIDIKFTAEQPAFRNFLNKIVASQTQFFIPRNIEIGNTAKAGPQRGETASVAVPTEPVVASPPADANAPAPPVGAPPSLAVPGGASALPTEAYKFIVGDEKVNVTLRLDLIDFTEPAAAASK